MGWRERLRQITLAGGMLPLLGCGSGTTPGGIPCGNANPDPCICDRPATSAEFRAECDAKNACESTGGTWVPGPTPSGACETDGGSGGDATPGSDDGAGG
jgi:hypothetical protein